MLKITGLRGVGQCHYHAGSVIEVLHSGLKKIGHAHWLQPEYISWSPIVTSEYPRSRSKIRLLRAHVIAGLMWLHANWPILGLPLVIFLSEK